LRRTLLSVRAAGGQAVVVIYDLLPVLQAQHFVETVRKAFPAWLALISTHADALLCISRTVAEEMLAWLDQHPPVRRRPLRLGWFHLGADFSTAPEEAAPARRPELLMVGTVEPRKGHVDALDAMETVWRKGGDLGLVIVGRAGWHTEALQARLRSHPERGQRLRWLENADDDEVSALYRRSAGLLMASEGEGFGLPLVEAAHAGLPVIARDLPIFREIAGDGALYFEGGRLAETIERWMALREEGRLPDPSRIIALSWAEASRRVAQIVMEGDWYAEWPRPRLTETAMQVAAPAS
jgi:glycosyltransferase involved in cell wall biosynthesis